MSKYRGCRPPRCAPTAGRAKPAHWYARAWSRRAPASTTAAGKPNARLDQAQTNAFCRLSPRDTALLERAVDGLQLSARSLHRILRVARTIADLAGSDVIDTPHLTEAIGYRKLERGRERAAA